MVEHDRLLDPDARVARCLASLFNPHLYPGIGRALPISQEEIGHLAGLSRQRVNQALQALEQAGLLRVDYGGITVLDLAGLRASTIEQPSAALNFAARFARNAAIPSRLSSVAHSRPNTSASSAFALARSMSWPRWIRCLLILTATGAFAAIIRASSIPCPAARSAATT